MIDILSFSNITYNNNNPCPPGYEMGTIDAEIQFNNTILQNITFIVCKLGINNPSFVIKNIGLAIGLSIGLGLPSLICLCYLFKITHTRIKEDEFNNNYMANIAKMNYVYPINNNEKSSNEIIFEKLGSKLHKNYLSGNLTYELKDCLKNFSISDLELFEKNSREHNRIEIADYIQSVINTNKNNIDNMYDIHRVARLHKDYINGNLTTGLKNIYKDKELSITDLEIFEKTARKKNKIEIADYIQSVINTKKNIIQSPSDIV